MSNEAISLAIDILRATIGERYQDQYHLAERLMLHAVENGAKGPEIGTPEEMRRWFDPSNWGDTKITQPHENGGRSEPVRITDADRRMSPSEQRNDVKSGPSSTHGHGFLQAICLNWRDEQAGSARLTARDAKGQLIAFQNGVATLVAEDAIEGARR